MSVSLEAIGIAVGDTPPYSLDEYYNIQFTDGTSTPSGGFISMYYFLNRTIVPPGGGALVTSYSLSSTDPGRFLFPPTPPGNVTSYGPFTIQGINGSTDVAYAFDRLNYTDYYISPWQFENHMYFGPTTYWPGVGDLAGPWVKTTYTNFLPFPWGIVVTPQYYPNMPQKLRLLGRGPGETNWTLIFSTDDPIGYTGFGPGNMEPMYIQFGNSGPQMFGEYVFVWLDIATSGPTIPRLSQFNVLLS